MKKQEGLQIGGMGVLLYLAMVVIGYLGGIQEVAWASDVIMWAGWVGIVSVVFLLYTVAVMKSAPGRGLSGIRYISAVAFVLGFGVLWIAQYFDYSLGETLAYLLGIVANLGIFGFLVAAIQDIR